MPSGSPPSAVSLGDGEIGIHGTHLTSENIDYHTPYNFAYHGYWVNDPTKLNPRFGSADDLKKLSAELHKRNMWLMVDIVVQNVPALENIIDSPEKLAEDGSLWTSREDFHDFCIIKDYSNLTQVENCSLGDEKLVLLDVNTENANVQTKLNEWIASLVKEYNIDGLRIDAAKHVPGEFWTSFCGAAGVFCIGEVFGDDMEMAVKYQKNKYLDSILGFPLYYGIQKGFGVPYANMTEFTSRLKAVQEGFVDTTVLGNFLESHDVPRWRNQTVDPRLGYNAQVAQFLLEGIPVVYYGSEQDFAGNMDPTNREALWPSNYENTTTYQQIARLNQIRTAIIEHNLEFNGELFLNAKSQIVDSTDYDVAIRRGPVLFSITNRGSPENSTYFPIHNTGWDSVTPVIDLLTCTEFTVGSGGSLSVSYSTQGYGGLPYVWVTTKDAKNLGLCTDKQMGIVSKDKVNNDASDQNKEAAKKNSGSKMSVSVAMAVAALLGTTAAALL